MLPGSRWVNRALSHFSRTRRPYQPDFSDAALFEPLTKEGSATSGNHRVELSGSSATGRPDDAALHAAFRARELFGPRLFVSPDSIPALWARLERDYPHWRQSQIERTKADAADGIPLYDLTGPTLGADFPWLRPAGNAASDTLYSVRPHRFAFAPRAGLACLYDPRAAARLRGTLESWIEAAASGTNPYCYASNLCVIQRILALSWCWTFLAARQPDTDVDGAALELLVLRIIRADIGFLEPQLGNAARNNHLLADRFAGWYLRMTLPEFLQRPETSDEGPWRDELLAQTYPDGGSFEHSAHYHEFACEMGVAYLLLCKRHHRTADPDVVARVEALLRFQMALTGPGSVPLPIGDGTEDTLFPLDVGEGWCPGSLRELYRALFRPDVDPAPSHDVTVIRAYWLLGGELARRAATCADDAVSSFPDSGLYIQKDRERGACLSFRTGPAPGVTVAAGHMHADFLSVYLAIGEQQMLVDAGTYTYRRTSDRRKMQAQDLRSYFSGSAAHNCLTVPGHDPLGKLAGDFRSAQTTARVITQRRASGLLDLVEARLLGPPPYGETRRTCVHLRGGYWLIFDKASPEAIKTGNAWYGFQCAAGARVSIDGHHTRIAPSAGDPALSLLGSRELQAPTLHEGCDDPPGGWVSRGYGHLTPAPQIRYGVGVAPYSAFLLAAHPASDQSPVLDVTCIEDGAALARVRWGDVEDTFLYSGRAEAHEPHRHGDICFEGQLLWLRMRDGRPIRLEWLNGRKFSWKRHGVNIECDGPHRDLIFSGTESPTFEAHASFRLLEWPSARSRIPH